MFRSDFVWGVAASAYQVEGRMPDDGAGSMIWDKFVEEGHIIGSYGAETNCGASSRINFLVNIDFHRIFPFLYLTYIL